MVKLSIDLVLRLMNGCIHLPFLKSVKLPFLLGRVRFKDIASVSLGKKVVLGDGVTLGSDVTIGNHTFIGSNTYIDGKVVIGNNISISRNVSLLTHTHSIHSTERRAGDVYLVSPLEIGDGAWIGTDAIVLPQVNKIGSFSIIGASAVVTKDVPENVVVASNPAKIIKALEPLQSVSALLSRTIK